MSNHYHLLLETPEVGLSRGMHWLNQRYAVAFNARHGRVGHLFQSRFHGLLVERETHLLALLRYIVLNPVRCGAVADAGDYEWSSYRVTAGLLPPPTWLETEWTLAQFGPDRAAAQAAYRRYVAAGAAASYDPRKAIVGQIYVGGADFAKRMQERADANERSREIPTAQRSFARPAFEKLVTLVAESFGVRAEQLREKSRGAAKKALVQLAVDEAGQTVKFVARWMRVSEWAASKMRSIGRELYATDSCYREQIDRIKAALS